jgi:type II secretory pathway component GspD/PulD (secretin)
MTARGSWWGIGLSALLLISTPRSGLSAPADNPPEKLITVTIKDQPLREVLRDVSAQTGLVFRVEPDVPDIHINLSIREITAEALVRLLLRQASVAVGDHSVTYQVEKRVYVVKLGPPEIRQDPTPPGELVEGNIRDPKLRRKLTFKVKDEPFEKLIARIFEGSGVSYGLQSKVRSVTVTLAVKDVSALDAARLAVRQLEGKLPGAGLWRWNGSYTFGVATQSANLPNQP